MCPQAMLSISDQHLAAHEREQRQRSDALAVQWYRQQGDRLPQGSPEFLRGLLAQAHETAELVGLELDEDRRLRLLMAFHSLMPEPSDDQWLLGIDVVFDVSSPDEAIGSLRRLAGPVS